MWPADLKSNEEWSSQLWSQFLQFCSTKQCCSVLPLFHQSAILKWVTWVLLANHESLSYFQAQAFRVICQKDGGRRGPRGYWWTAREPATKKKKNKRKKEKEKDQGQASLEGFESWNFQQMYGSIALKFLWTTPGSFSSTRVYLACRIRNIPFSARSVHRFSISLDTVIPVLKQLQYRKH